MTPYWVDMLGYVGAFLTAITLIPQVLKAWQTKSVGDLSLLMIFIILTSCGVWLTYSIYLRLIPVLLANLILLCMALCLLYFKLHFKKEQK